RDAGRDLDVAVVERHVEVADPGAVDRRAALGGEARGEIRELPVVGVGSERSHEDQDTELAGQVPHRLPPAQNESASPVIFHASSSRARRSSFDLRTSATYASRRFFCSPSAFDAFASSASSFALARRFASSMRFFARSRAVFWSFWVCWSFAFSFVFASPTA